MDKNAILDLLALIRTGSISLAAQTRNASQSGYSRRLQALEHLLGAELVDRTRRPSGPTAFLKSQKLELETGLVAMNRLADAFAVQPFEPLRLAALHSISANILPRALAALDDVMAMHDIRLRSANLESCFQMLMTEEVVAALFYETEARRLNPPLDLVQRTTVGRDGFIPVCAPEYIAPLKDKIARDDPVALITYPSEVFMGDLTRSALLPALPFQVSMKLVSGLTQTIQQSIRCGLGVGWLPMTATTDDLRAGHLVQITDLGFPRAELDLTILRLRTKSLAEFKPTIDAICLEISEILRLCNSAS